MTSSEQKPFPPLAIAIAIAGLLGLACVVSWFVLRELWDGRPSPLIGALIAAIVAAAVAGVTRLALSRRPASPELSRIETAPRSAKIALPVSLALFYLSYGYAVAYFDLLPSPDHPQLNFTEDLRPDKGTWFNITAKYDVIGCDDDVDVTLAVWPRDGPDPADEARDFEGEPVRVELAEQTKPPRDEDPADPLLLPDPVGGFPVQRRQGSLESPRDKSLRLIGQFPGRGRPAIFHFSADWVERRNQTSCVLPVPQFKDPDGEKLQEAHYLGKSWSAVIARQTVEIVREETNPVPRFDDNGVPAWECADTGFNPQCEATAVFQELDADDERDFNLLLISAGLSLGTALFLEAVFRIA